MSPDIISYADAIEKVLLNNGYIATLKYVYANIERYRPLTGKTPFATIQALLQRDKRFFRIGLGVYGLSKYKAILDSLRIKSDLASKLRPLQESKHDKMQGMVLELGEHLNYSTFTNDKAKVFEGKSFNQISSLIECPEFTYRSIIDQTVRYIDVVWFNNRNFPAWVFEIEHSTDFRSALVKFIELQDFYIKFVIIAPKDRETKFKIEINKRAFESIYDRCQFRSYDEIEDYYHGLITFTKVRHILI
ncbi:MAG: hypothetical protein FJY65_06540 [Calditrichaeota bacterium]|nr:hypothetical protein [Calditrichota bacterium]